MPRIHQTPVRNAGASAGQSAQPRNVAGVRDAGVRKARKAYGNAKPHRFRPGTQALREIR